MFFSGANTPPPIFKLCRRPGSCPWLRRCRWCNGKEMFVRDARPLPGRVYSAVTQTSWQVILGHCWEVIVQRCFTSTETVRTITAQGAQDAHLGDSHTAPELWPLPLSAVKCCFTSTETIRISLLGTGSSGHPPRISFTAQLRPDLWHNGSSLAVESVTVFHDDDDDDVELNVLGCRVNILGTNWDHCVSTVQCCFTSTETIRLIRTGSPGRPPRLSTQRLLWLWPRSGFKCSSHTWPGGGGGGGELPRQ